MNSHFQSILLKATGAKAIKGTSVIQSLWSGYGQIIRCKLSGAPLESVVVKHVHFPTNKKHPRGWNSDLGHQRKVKSYEVEMAWYKRWSKHSDAWCRTPKCLAFEQHDDEVFMVLEDLNAAGFPERLNYVNWSHIETCLSWLAAFHATYMGKQPEELWPIGTYWHLNTRPDELEVLNDKLLKQSAHKIDRLLNDATYKTFVHGDAKLANFCFSNSGEQVAAVDFQYIGGGCGMKDVAYFIGSCLNEEECERKESDILNFYFSTLKKELENRNIDIDYNALEKEWRALYPVAWTDFHRFLKGWSPGHWKINSYSERLTREVIASLK